MWPCMKLKHLQQHLQDIRPFESPKIKLEQYVTPPHLSSNMLYTIQSQYGDITGKTVADLGCGCGALSIGAAILDSSFVVGFEVDPDAVEISNENICDYEIGGIDVIQCDVMSIVPGRFKGFFDTVVMNPPFGTKSNPGVDMEFLRVALELSSNAVYSLHKTSTRAFVLKKAESLGAKGEVLAEMRYDLPKTFKFHKKDSVDIEVDFVRFLKCN